MIPSVLVSCPVPQPRDLAWHKGLTFIGQTGVLIRSSVGIGRSINCGVLRSLSVTLLLPVLHILAHGLELALEEDISLRM